MPTMFMDEYEVGVSYPYDDALVVIIGIGPSDVSKILIDMGNSIDIIFNSTLDFLKINNLRLGPINTSLYRFAKSYTVPIGIV